MLCATCKAELRPGARFCNVCGARQPEGDPGQTQAPTSAETDDSGVRAKRPPRVPRPNDDDDAQANGRETPSSAQIATSMLPHSAETVPVNGSATPPEDHIPNAGLRDFLINPDDESPAAPRGASSQPDATSFDWESADTAEQRAQHAAANGGSPASAPVVVRFAMPPLDELARATADDDGFPFGPGAGPDDALPWPLPPSIIVGGRYRVERLISPPAETTDEENQYIVADLQGYERCWSCGKSNGAEAARDQYCQSCGADMLAREYVMTERMLPADVETTGDATSDVTDAVTSDVDADVDADVDGASATPESGAENTPAGSVSEESAPVETAPDEPTASEGESSEGESAPPEGAGSGVETREFVQGKRAYRVTPRVIEAPAFPLGARVLVATATDVGRTRMGEHNEDSVAALVVTLGYDSRTLPLALGLVADGLGGHANGQDASRLVAKTIAEQIVKSVAAPFTTLPPSALEGESGLDQALLEAARAANTKLCAENQQTGGDMGSTLVAALVCGDTAFVVNVGDSRAYVFDGGELRRLTTDHSLVEQLIQSGIVTPEDRYTHPKRNQIFRSLGDDPNMPMDLFIQKLTPGMRLLLCSDGLWEMAHDEQMRDILTQTAAPHAACDALIRAANENGGEDNISCVLIDVSA